jgi:hypothetical protein
MFRKFAVSVVLLSLSACGGSSGPGPPTPRSSSSGSSSPIRVEDGTAGAGPAWVSTPGLVDDTIRVADIAVTAWGGPPRALSGWTVRYVIRGTAPGCPALALGCTQAANRLVQVAAEPYLACPAASALAHEVGHVLIGDPGHTDPRWDSPDFWTSVARALVPTAGGTTCVDEITNMAIYEPTLHVLTPGY